jgi:hypothetical protein
LKFFCCEKGDGSNVVIFFYLSFVMKKAKAMVSLSCSVIAMPLSFFVLFCYKKGDDNGAIIFFYCINAIVFFYPSFVARKVTTTMSSSLCVFFFHVVILFFGLSSLALLVLLSKGEQVTPKLLVL